MLQNPSSNALADQPSQAPLFTAFAGTQCIAHGDLASVATQVHNTSLTAPDTTLWVFNDQDGRQVELDLRGTLEAVLQRLPAHPTLVALLNASSASTPQPEPIGEPADEAPRRPGRPRLGVVPREVTLLPRHWDWLNAQLGGASVALRKLVEEARRHSQTADRARLALEASYRFMQAMAGDAPGFEEASRALFAADTSALHQWTAAWPADVRSYMLRLAAPALHNHNNPSAPLPTAP